MPYVERCLYLLRVLGLTSMQKIFRELARRGVDTSRMRALEVYGAKGELHTQDYARQVGSLEVWESKAELEPDLRRNLPGAMVRIVDSYRQIRETREKFDLVVVDNPAFTHDGHVEHFDLFPHVLRILRTPGVLIVNVLPTAGPSLRSRFPSLFNNLHLRRREEFYGASDPGDISWERILGAYQSFLAAEGLNLDWHFIQHRAGALKWLPIRSSFLLSIRYLVLGTTARGRAGDRDSQRPLQEGAVRQSGFRD